MVEYSGNEVVPSEQSLALLISLKCFETFRFSAKFTDEDIVPDDQRIGANRLR